MPPNRVADLMQYWIMANRTDMDKHKTRAMLEMPPPGYAGSLRGTVWDADAMIADYANNGG